LLLETSGDLVIQGVHAISTTGRPANANSDPLWHLEGLACFSDLAVSGTPLAGTSHMTSNQRFVYTDWSFQIGEILEANPADALKPGAVITVLSTGGRLTIDGRTVIANDNGFTEFVPGQHYALYLKFIPQTKAYQAMGDDSFLLLDDKVEVQNPIYRRAGIPGGFDEPSGFLAAARSAVSNMVGKPDCAGRR
jgi:hypothetical protein